MRAGQRSPRCHHPCWDVSVWHRVHPGQVQPHTAQAAVTACPLWGPAHVSTGLGLCSPAGNCKMAKPSRIGSDTPVLGTALENTGGNADAGSCVSPAPPAGPFSPGHSPGQEPSRLLIRQDHLSLPLSSCLYRRNGSRRHRDALTQMAKRPVIGALVYSQA